MLDASFLGLLTAPEPRPEARPLIIDSFAGGGGASTGIERALGRSPDIAINHDAEALSMHRANHPTTLHLNTNIWQVDPAEACRGRTVGLAWFSPDCKHHSKAKGGKPVQRSIRDLAWVVVLWAKRVRPQVIMLENVEEFQDWGPLTADNRPDPDRRGATFQKWVAELRRLGYSVEWRELRACDYGAPTIRKRLFLIARRDGRPIVWPEASHGKPSAPEVIAGSRAPWRTAADIIDWSLPCPSIFDTSDEIMARHGLRAIRPLAEATLRRIARGVMRYVVQAEQPFFVTYGQHGGANRSATDPMHTVTASTKDQNAIVVPNLISVAHGYSGGRREYPLTDPIGTQTVGGIQHALIAPTLINVANSKTTGRGPNAWPVGEPTRTLTQSPGFAIVAPHLMTMRNAGKPFSAADEPTHTITAGGAHLMAVSAFLAQHNTGVIGRPATAPVSTITTRGTQQQIVAAHLMNMHGSARSARPLSDPHPSICAGGQHGAIIAAFLQKYYGQGLGQDAAEPLHTLGTRDTFGLVTVSIEGQTYAITDIGMRMLTPREQFRAQGFGDDYIIDTGGDGEPITKTAQTRMCGNSVCPDVAEALARANCQHLISEKETAHA